MREGQTMRADIDFKMKIKVLKVLRGATLGMCMDITVMVSFDTNLRKQNQNHYKSL